MELQLCSLEQCKALKEAFNNDEVWKPVPDFEGLYEISSAGRVKVLTNRQNWKARIINGTLGAKGYYLFAFSNKPLRLHTTVHRMVATVFLPNTNNRPCVNHINGIRTDNRVENLEWCTYSENNKHQYTHLHRQSPLSGKQYGKNHNAIPIIQIYDSGEQVEWDSLQRAAHELNMTVSGISLALSGKIKNNRYKGYKWMKR